MAVEEFGVLMDGVRAQAAFGGDLFFAVTVEEAEENRAEAGGEGLDARVVAGGFGFAGDVVEAEGVAIKKLNELAMAFVEGFVADLAMDCHVEDLVVGKAQAGADGVVEVERAGDDVEMFGAIPVGVVEDGAAALGDIGFGGLKNLSGGGVGGGASEEIALAWVVDVRGAVGIDDGAGLGEARAAGAVGFEAAGGGGTDHFAQRVDDVSAPDSLVHGQTRDFAT